MYSEATLTDKSSISFETAKIMSAFSTLFFYEKMLMFLRIILQLRSR